MRRREFLRATGLAAGVAATGLESIVAARRAPAFAQETRLNILRWVDFVPACDVELKRQAGEASKALDALRQVGMKLKKKGKPIGQTLGHTFGDAPAWAYPLMWGFGGMEVDRTGKKVALDSKATVESVKFMQAYWKDACDEGGFAWDDTSNNRAFLAGEISATLNGASIYIAAKRARKRSRTRRASRWCGTSSTGRSRTGPPAPTA